MKETTIRNLLITTTLALALPVSIAIAQDDPLPAGFETQPLIKTIVNRDNEPIVYPTGKPEIISVIGTLDKGGRTALHEHPVPVYVYILEGEIELKSEGSAPHRYKAGEAFVETQNRKHQAFNVADTPTKLLVVFVGEEGKSPTVAAQ
jgi:quercetin dioxygenase-like cupin family protein